MYLHAVAYSMDNIRDSYLKSLEMWDYEVHIKLSPHLSRGLEVDSKTVLVM